MKDIGKKIKNYIMKLSYQERRKRELESFEKELAKYRNMTNDELKYEYIKLKTEYEHKKGVLTLFVVSIALAILTNVWSKFFSFMEQVFQYAATRRDAGVDVIGVSFFISIVVLVFITLIVIASLLILADDMKMIRRKVMMIEDVMERKNI